MPSGLQIWDASGNLVLDTNMRLGRILGYVEVSSNGSQAVAGFSTGEGFAKVLSNVDGVGPGAYPYPPEASVSGTTLSWSYPDANNRGTAIIIYGVR